MNFACWAEMLLQALLGLEASPFRPDDVKSRTFLRTKPVDVSLYYAVPNSRRFSLHMIDANRDHVRERVLGVLAPSTSRIASEPLLRLVVWRRSVALPSSPPPCLRGVLSGVIHGYAMHGMLEEELGSCQDWLLAPKWLRTQGTPST